jgi:hypothetical protein
MAHKCKICGKLDNRCTQYGRNGWYHPRCVFESWQAALKELDEYRHSVDNAISLDGTDEADVDRWVEMVRQDVQQKH